jgi:deazaflavin-dependent oxidoreductase (nitroreductase family)
MSLDLAATSAIRCQRHIGAEVFKERGMAAGEFEQALEGAREVDITVTGRRSGRQITIPVWFVKEDDRLFLLPVRGPDADWYKNLVKNQTIRLAVDGAEHTTRVTPITEPTRVGDVVDRFRAKYGAGDVASYYSRPEVAVEVPLT